MSKFFRKMNQKKKTKFEETVFSHFKFSSRYFSFLVVVLLGTVSLLYLAQINSRATKGFEIRDLEERADFLQKNNKLLELEAVELQSMKMVQDKISRLNLVSTINPEYIEPASPVALK